MMRLEKVDTTINERVALLERTRWAAGTPASPTGRPVPTRGQLEKLAAYVDVFRAPEGHTIFSEGEDTSYMCFLVSGSVAIKKTDSDGQDRSIVTLGPGNAFGEMSMIDDEPRSAAAVATSDLSMLVLTKENFDRLNEQVPGLGIILVLNIAKLLSRRLRITSGAVIDLLDHR